MSFFERIVFNKDKIDREYTIKTYSGAIYKFESKNSDLKYEDGMLIFTNSDKYRIAINVGYIETVTWDVSKN